MGHMVVVEGDSPPAADVLTAVGKTAPAGVRHLIPGGRTLVAGYVNNLNYIRIVRMAAHGHFDALGQNGALLIDAAAHGRLLAGDNYLGYVHHTLQKLVGPCHPGSFPEDFVF